MTESNWSVLSGGDPWSILAYFAPRLGTAVLAGALIGWERERTNKPAGLRTSILIAMGAMLFTVISMEFPGTGNVRDPARIAAQIVTGVGFLGAGVIMQSRGSIRGMTTAATIWTVASIGMAAGAGFYLVALVSTFVVLAVLWGVERFERWSGLKRPLPSTLNIMVEPDGLDDVLKILTSRGHRYSLRRDNGSWKVWAQLDETLDPEHLKALLEIEGVDSVEVRQD